MKNNIKAIVFDIDGTLSSNMSWRKLTLSLGASVPDHLKIYEDFRTGKLEYEESKRLLLKLWRGEGNLHKNKLKEIFDRWIIKEDAIPVFSYLKSRGYIICLITGSFDLFAQTIAEKVGADFWYANTILHWDENDVLQDFDYELNAADKKLEQFKKFINQNSLKNSECVAVGDDSNDIELFKITQHGIIVESPTSSVLEPFAWKKVKNLIEIKNIL